MDSGSGAGVGSFGASGWRWHFVVFVMVGVVSLYAAGIRGVPVAWEHEFRKMGGVGGHLRVRNHLEQHSNLK